MTRFRVSLLLAVAPIAATLFLGLGHARSQEVALTPLQATEVAKGYRADSLKLKSVVNEKGESLGRIADFIFGKDGNIYAILSIGDYAGIPGHLIAIPFRNLKLDVSPENIVLPGISRAALDKLPVYVRNQ